ncbi:Scr1 family TA system antitoxin-like transcriptional regulator [Streptomyces reniochalinae]|uniref:Scr1 family TA system antitoxin-like transcriptional regulator n=1 Tax=Streptomyces reniochalinae TaxID=2250578 RepID=UPI003CCC8009
MDRYAERRVARQKVWDRDDPPWMWAVLDSGVLRRATGDQATTRGQLCKLREMAGLPQVAVQLLPETATGILGLIRGDLGGVRRAVVGTDQVQANAACVEEVVTTPPEAVPSRGSKDPAGQLLLLASFWSGFAQAEELPWRYAQVGFYASAAHKGCASVRHCSFSTVAR